jgi:hypothetical protein
LKVDLLAIPSPGFPNFSMSNSCCKTTQDQIESSQFSWYHLT